MSRTVTVNGQTRTYDGVSTPPREHEGYPFKALTTGAVRSTDADGVRHDLISTVGLRRLAETYAEGAAKYGVDNWRKGFPFSNLLNHLLEHINRFRDGDSSEDHLAHAAWGLFTLMEFQERRPDLDDRHFVRMPAGGPDLFDPTDRPLIEDHEIPDYHRLAAIQYAAPGTYPKPCQCEICRQFSEAIDETPTTEFAPGADDMPSPLGAGEVRTLSVSTVLGSLGERLELAFIRAGCPPTTPEEWGDPILAGGSIVSLKRATDAICDAIGNGDRAEFSRLAAWHVGAMLAYATSLGFDVGAAIATMIEALVGIPAPPEGLVFTLREEPDEEEEAAEGLAATKAFLNRIGELIYAVSADRKWVVATLSPKCLNPVGGDTKVGDFAASLCDASERTWTAWRDNDPSRLRSALAEVMIFAIGGLGALGFDVGEAFERELSRSARN